MSFNLISVEMMCASHYYVYPYTKYMGMARPDPEKIYYNSHFIAIAHHKIKRKDGTLRISRERDYEGMFRAGFFSDYEAGSCVCCPLIWIDN